MNTRVSQGKNQRTGQRVSQRTGQKKKNNIRILRPKRRMRLNVGRIILLGIFVAFIVWAIYPITYRLEQNRELSDLKHQLSEIERQNDELKKDVKRLRSDEYVEQRARSLGLSKEDEEIIVVVPERPRGSSDGVGSNGALEETDKKAKENSSVSLWNRAMNTFLDIF